MGVCRAGALGAPESCLMCLWDICHLRGREGACQRGGCRQNSRTGRAVTFGGALGPPSVGTRNWWAQSTPTSSRVGAKLPRLGKCQKPSGWVDRCVFSICLTPGAWQMGCRDQAAENLDPFQTAPFPVLRAERFWRAAEGPSPGVLRAPGSPTGTSHRTWLC